MQRRRHRQGFTITELLVAMALIIFIMYILAEAFSAGSTAFRNLKAIGDMNEKLRTTGGLLRRHLERDHFDGKRRVSDQDFWKDGPPHVGFLRVYNGSAPSNSSSAAYYVEGTDLDGNSSARAVDHGLHFTVKLRGNNRGDYFRAGVPAASPLSLLPLQDTRFQESTTDSVSGSWAEVVVFLRDSQQMTDDPDATVATTPQRLHTLYVRQRVLVPDNKAVRDAATASGLPVPLGSQYPQYAEVSCHQDPNGPAAPNSILYFNSPADVTMPARRLGETPGSATAVSGPTPVNGYPMLETEAPALAGNDVVLTNVLSFEVKVLLDRSQWNAYYQSLTPAQQPAFYDFVPLSHPAIQSFSRSNPAFPATGPFVFDTWSQAKDDWQDYVGGGPVPLWAQTGLATSVPLYQNASGRKIRILAVQLTIRIWDGNTKQTRQSSVVMDL